jgi:tetratricopeptide (TPR) repeat protein
MSRRVRIILWCSIIASLGLPHSGMAETCEAWMARMVSVQGSVQTRRAGETHWRSASLHDTYCPGDTLWVQERSRAAILLPNDTLLRLDQKTTITFTGLTPARTSWLDLLSGAVYFFSRIPRGLRVTTPFVNAAVEGTEFFVQVEGEQTLLSVFAGQVVATNRVGSLLLTGGQSATAEAEQAPTSRVVVRPRDAVQWALYYPPLLDVHLVDFPSDTAWSAMGRESLQFYSDGNLPAAFASLAGVPEDVRDARFFTYRAALLLTVGRLEEAQTDIDRALQLEPRHSPGFALRAVIAVAQNNKTAALALARQAVALAPTASAAHLALSYAQQAHFDLHGALTSLQEVVQLAPHSALAHARLAELWLSVGDVDRARRAAQAAVARRANLARTQTVLGFAWLTQIKIREAQQAFTRAIALDQADPLPRLGLGLAYIRQGALPAGRGEIEIAASLDPHNALIRSYLGKAYFEEKRDKQASDQLAIARELDPLDPTPWFYDAILKQTTNRPVEALHDLQQSIALNDNRAVYRSRLLLDADLAARSATLARIYNDLGFQRLALVEGWKSLHSDPTNYSAHRLLADSYAALPRHGAARVSELLQSQLLQPLNITPVQPQLAENELFILQGAGPAEPSFNEFNPLFLRNRLALLASGLLGEHDTFGDEVVHAGVWGRVSYSLGQFHRETDGFRDNNDLRQDLYNAFVQVALSHKTSVQAEFRYADIAEGDRGLSFFPAAFIPTLRQQRQTQTARLGLHHALTPGSDIIASVIYKDVEAKFQSFPAAAALDEAGLLAEGQYLRRSGWVNVIGGVGHFATVSRRAAIMFFPDEPPEIDARDIQQTNLYVYSLLNYLPNVTVTLGVSADFFNGTFVERHQVNPKLGLTWHPAPATTLRAALFRVLNTGVIAAQTIEPTQVAGFNQFTGK